MEPIHPVSAEDFERRITELSADVAKISGKLETLEQIVITQFGQLGEDINKPSHFDMKTVVQFSAVVLVPILVALIGMYAAIQGAK